MVGGIGRVVSTLHPVRASLQPSFVVVVYCRRVSVMVDAVGGCCIKGCGWAWLVEPVEKLVELVSLPHERETILRVAASDDLHSLPHLPDVIVLDFLLYFPSVFLLCLPELDSEFPMYPLKLMSVAIFKGLLLLVQKGFHVTSYPGLFVGKAAYRSNWDHNVHIKVNIV